MLCLAHRGAGVRALTAGVNDVTSPRSKKRNDGGAAKRPYLNRPRLIEELESSDIRAAADTFDVLERLEALEAMMTQPRVRTLADKDGWQ